MNVNTFNSYYKKVTYGYIRKYVIQSHDILIPIDLITLCVSYIEMEYFSKCGKNIKIINNNYEIISVSGYDCHTAFGNLLIPSTNA